MMVKAEKAPEENPYHLSEEELTYPGTRGKRWLKKLAARQREGIDHGVRPQLPKKLSSTMWGKWRDRVWDYYLSTKSEEERRIIMGTVDSEIEWDWKKSKDPYRERNS